MKKKNSRPERPTSSVGEMTGIPPVETPDDALAALHRAQCMTHLLKEILLGEQVGNYCDTTLGELGQIAYELTQQVIEFLESNLQASS